MIDQGDVLEISGHIGQHASPEQGRTAGLLWHGASPLSIVLMGMVRKPLSAAILPAPGPEPPIRTLFPISPNSVNWSINTDKAYA